MKKRMIGFLAVAVLACTLVTAPGAKAAPPPPVSQNFIKCTHNVYKNKRPMTRSGCVWRIQNFLNEMKWMRAADDKSVRGWPTLKMDTIYGPQTEKAVKAYQRATRSDGIPGNAGKIDGIVGPKTWASIHTDCVTRWGHQHQFYSKTCFVTD